MYNKEQEVNNNNKKKIQLTQKIAVISSYKKTSHCYSVCNSIYMVKGNKSKAFELFFFSYFLLFLPSSV